MARPKAQDVEKVAAEESDMSLLTESPTDWEWDTVVDESPTLVEFDTVGDTFIGLYEGRKTITPDNGRTDPFDLFYFKGRDNQPYATNTSYKLDGALTDDMIGKWVRIVLTKEIPTGRGLQPMKDFRVDVKR